MSKLYWMLFGMALASLSGCGYNPDKYTIDWISNHRKPIICIKGDTTVSKSEIVWTLVDADANVYSTGRTYMVFPDTLKTSIQLIEK